MIEKYRYEIKYPIPFSIKEKIKINLLKKGMKLLYPPRTVNSIYFDNLSYQSYCDSNEGILPRHKIRVRYYNKNKKKLFLEKKITDEFGRYKEIKIISDSEFDKFYKNGFFDEKYLILQKKLLVTYQREYFSFSDVRITIDSNIKYQNLNHKLHRIFDETECVVELKSSIKNISRDKITNILPSSDLRFSKYCKGIEKIS